LKEQDIESIIAIDAAVTGQGGPERAGFWRGLLAFYPAEAGEPSPPQPHLCMVAESQTSGQSRVVGFIIGDVQSWQFGLPRHGRIVTIGVHPEHRRKQVASLLVQAILETFRKMGLPSVQCLSRPGDPLGDFFRAAGFGGTSFEVLEKAL
jgi:ribosomal protein S18 acetylase RimI-like enzyme